MMALNVNKPANTKLISEFGCITRKALYQSPDCKELFDFF